jgi:hypothetical protein
MTDAEPGRYQRRGNENVCDAVIAGHRRAETTPFFERLCPAMTSQRNLFLMDARVKPAHDEAEDALAQLPAV